MKVKIRLSWYLICLAALSDLPTVFQTFFYLSMGGVLWVKFAQQSWLPIQSYQLSIIACTVGILRRCKSLGLCVSKNRGAQENGNYLRMFDSFENISF